MDIKKFIAELAEFNPCTFRSHSHAEISSFVEDEFGIIDEMGVMVLKDVPVYGCSALYHVKTVITSARMLFLIPFGVENVIIVDDTKLDAVERKLMTMRF